MINAPSLANCNIFTIGEEMDEMIKGGVHLVHVDICDYWPASGSFVH